MTETNDPRPETLRFYFSFRSPYAWFAAEKFEDEFGDLPVRCECVPIFPTPELFPNDPSKLPAKQAYLIQDVPRLARELGLQVRFPNATDTDWALPHAAFLEADRLGRGMPFMVGVFRKRFSEGLDVGLEEVVGDVAKGVGLDPRDVLKGGRDEARRALVSDAWRRACEEDGIFGVPSFVFAGKLYWGQDRMRFVRSAVLRKTGST